MEGEEGGGRRCVRSEDVKAVVRAAEEPRPVLWAPERGVGKDVKGVVEGVVVEEVGWE